MAIQNGTGRITKIYHGGNLMYQDIAQWKELKPLDNTINSVLYKLDGKKFTAIVLGNYANGRINEDIVVANLPDIFKGMHFTGKGTEFHTKNISWADLTVSNEKIIVNYSDVSGNDLGYATRISWTIS